MRRHPTDLVSLAFGLIFLLVAAAWLVARFFDIRMSGLAWGTVAGGLIVLGLTWAVLRARRRDDAGQETTKADRGRSR